MNSYPIENLHQFLKISDLSSFLLPQIHATGSSVGKKSTFKIKNTWKSRFLQVSPIANNDVKTRAIDSC